jgi:RHS repeat-associated protein
VEYRNIPAVFLYYDGWNLIQEGPSATVPERIYVHGAGTDRIVASYRYSTGAAFYFYYDALGNCILASDAYTGNIAEQYDYDAFGHPYFYDSAGTPLPNGSTIGTRFLFTGREWLSDLKLYDYRNRMYQPELGRFMQPDPKHFEAGDYNLYRYCHNDPVNKNDPSGLDVSALPDWDRATIFQVNVMRPLWGLSNAESARIHVFAHGTLGGAMNTAVSQAVKNSARSISDVPASMRWTPEQIVAAIQADSNYKPDSLIELDICNAADRGPDGKSLQDKVAALLPPTNKILASSGTVSASDGKSHNKTPRKELPGTKESKKKDTP